MKQIQAAFVETVNNSISLNIIIIMTTIIVPPLGSAPKTSKKRTILMFLGIIVGIILLIGIVFSFFIGGDDTPEVSDNSVLEISFSSLLNEYGQQAGLFSDDKPMGFYEIINAIRYAKKDPHIKGIYIKAEGTPVGFVKLEEILDALQDFKKSGKFIYGFIETGTKSDYMLASIADSLFMPKEGLAELSAPGASVLFFKGMLEKIGVSMYVEQFEEYKSAGEPYSQDKFTPPAKEELSVIFQSRAKRMYERIASQRKMPVDVVTTLFNKGLYSADSIYFEKLIDGIAQETQVKYTIKKRIENDILKQKGSTDTLKKLSLITLSKYTQFVAAQKEENLASSDQAIAIISAVGPIRSGSNSSPNPFDQGALEIHSGSLVKQLQKASEDNDVKAIILRIDSPGGSVIASDEVWNSIIAIKKKKPVYASMSDVAASGGYYIPMACDTIIAHPQTITGSIGVIGMIPLVSGAMQKLGITVDTISTGSSSQDLNFMLPITEEKKLKIRNQMLPIYQRFVSKVAQSRSMTFEQARLLARGRVWLGSDAYKHGLVDTLGGLDLAISIAKKRIGIPTSKQPVLKFYPKQQDMFTALLQSLTKETEDQDAETTVKTLLSNVFSGNNATIMLFETLPFSVKHHLAYSWNMYCTGREEHVIAVMPYLPLF